MIQLPAHHAAMNRPATWTVASIIAAAIAVFDLLSAWATHVPGALVVLTIALFAIGLALFGALGSLRDSVKGAGSSPAPRTRSTS